MPHFAASELGLHYLLMSPKRVTIHSYGCTKCMKTPPYYKINTVGITSIACHVYFHGTAHNVDNKNKQNKHINEFIAVNMDSYVTSLIR